MPGKTHKPAEGEHVLKKPGLDSTAVYAKDYTTAVRFPHDYLVDNFAITHGQFMKITGRA